MKHSTVLDELSNVSAMFGANIDLVQGLGGNTSVKDDEVLWIKASGLALKDANIKNIFLPLNRRMVRKAIIDNQESAFKEAALPGYNFHNLRPSIETSLHEIMPHRAVFHGHPVETLSHVVLKHPNISFLEKSLEGLSWALVPYAKPGLELMRCIAERPGKDVYLLQNHGLLVGADTPFKAYECFVEVERRLSRKIMLPSGSIESIKSQNGFEVISSVWIKALVSNEALIKRLSNVTLYPDHLIILGHGIPVYPSVPSVSECRENDWFIVPNISAFGTFSRHPATDDMIEALARVAARLPMDLRLNSLNMVERAELLDWDAEKYRRSLSAEKRS
jgi:rhamnose utilization protein RhaD (predicted bifunctional aldolase and dehydrogenase)